ncbi:MAG: L,D-transpeptidase family protein [Gammaproteobacteria bacterium]
MSLKRSGLALGLLLLIGTYGDPVLATHDYVLEIHKSQRTLLLRHGGKVEKKYFIAHGQGGRGDKEHFGDRKTPIGTYKIVKIKDHSRFHSFFHLNYPNVKDAFFGLRDKLISEGDFDRIVSSAKHLEVPPQNTRLGGAIGIHGIGEETAEQMKIHGNLNWTKGCIALTNAQIDDLKKYIGLGTKVVITE